jgi:hypothetical protein
MSIISPPPPIVIPPTINIADFANWLTTFVGVPAAALPPDPADNQYVIAAFWASYANVNQKIFYANPWEYRRALYNLGMDNLCNFAVDPNPLPPGYPMSSVTGPNGQPLPYWAGLQQQFNVLGFVPGVVVSTSDESTSETLSELDAYKNFTLANLQNLKTPWGRTYIAIAQAVGTAPWGIS